VLQLFATMEILFRGVDVKMSGTAILSAIPTNFIFKTRERTGLKIT
jgi:hypothetical protein